MHLRPLLFSCSLLSISAFAADTPRLPRIPSKPIAEKKELLFSDDFDGTEHDAKWHRVVDTFVFEDGALKGTQTRVKDETSADGKTIVKVVAVPGRMVNFVVK